MSTDLVRFINNLDIRASFADEEGLELQGLIKKVARTGMLVCEIGSWKGHSTAYLAQIVQENKGMVYAIDTWQGSPGVWQHNIVQTKDVFRLFETNMKALGFDCVLPLVMPSLSAATILKDKIFDLIFIDANHLYKQVKADILAFLPKLRRGGIICGHDCEAYYSKQPLDIQKKIDLNCRGLSDEERFIKEIHYHPGVIRATYEIFNEKHTIFPGSRIWYWKNDKWY